MRRARNTSRSTVATISHHLNQPLTAIVGYADWLLRTGKLSSEDRETVQKIASEAAEMAQTIRRLERVSNPKLVTYVGKERIWDIDPSERDRGIRHLLAGRKELPLDEWAWVEDFETLSPLLDRSASVLLPRFSVTLWMHVEEEDPPFRAIGSRREAGDLIGSMSDALRSRRAVRVRSHPPHFLIPVSGARYRHGVLELSCRRRGALAKGELAAGRFLSTLVSTAMTTLRSVRETAHLRNYLVQIFDNATMIVMAMDSNGRIGLFNRAAEEALGYSAKDLTSRSFLELGDTEEDCRTLKASLLSARTKGMADPAKVRIRTRIGGVVEFRLHFSAMPEPGGKEERFLAIGENVTELQKLENQVIHADKLASLGQMAAGVAHELNTPVTALVAYSDALLKDATERGEEATVRRLQVMADAAERIQKLARGLTTLARPSYEGELQPLDLHEMIRSAIVYSEYELGPKNVHLETDFADDLPKIAGIAMNVQQVFINLLANAAQALGQREGHIVVKTEVLGESHVQASVSDDGAGISALHIERVFEPFFSTKAAGGTGLGLSIVRRILDHFGGGIDVRSREGEGTTFFVRFRRYGR